MIFARAAAAAILAASIGSAAGAVTHRDAVYQACLRDGESAAACSCAADRYRAELTDQEMAFYARMIGRTNDPSAMMTVRVEVGLSVQEVGALLGKLNRMDAEVRRACGFRNRGN